MVPAKNRDWRARQNALLLSPHRKGGRDGGVMNIQILRGGVLPFEELPPRCIALDGFCQGPAVDVESQRFSFDHHDGCVRLVTRATCQQVMDALLLGLDPTGCTVCINDVDGDTVLAVWLLQNPSRVAEPAVRALVEMVGAIDAHGPAYPVSDPKLADAFFQGVMAPEVAVRRAKTYGTCDLEELLAQCISNIDALFAGTLQWSPRPAKERSFEITHAGNGWVMAKSDDFVFDLLYAAGYTRAVAYQRLPDGSYAYTVGKKSDLVCGFPVGPHSTPYTILNALNAREAGWGGGSTIGGAPRNADGSRSRLTPDEVFDIVAGVVASK